MSAPRLMTRREEENGRGRGREAEGMREQMPGETREEVEGNAGRRQEEPERQRMDESIVRSIEAAETKSSNTNNRDSDGKRRGIDTQTSERHGKNEQDETLSLCRNATRRENQ